MGSSKLFYNRIHCKNIIRDEHLKFLEKLDIYLEIADVNGG